MTRKTKTEIALEALNDARGLKYPDKGYSYFANVAGDGRNYCSIFTIVGDAGGVTYSGLNHIHAPRQIAQIEHATRIALSDHLDSLRKADAGALITQALHSRGIRQRLALDEINRRGLWLSDDQKKQAGLTS